MCSKRGNMAVLSKWVVTAFAALAWSAAASAAPTVFSSLQEQTDAIPITLGGEPYTFWPAYIVAVTGLQPTDVVQCHAQAEVTSAHPFNIQVDRVIGKNAGGKWLSNDQASIGALSPLSGENITLNMHHMVVTTWATDTGETGTMSYALLLEAASTSAAVTDTLTLQRGDGGLWCTVFH